MSSLRSEDDRPPPHTQGMAFQVTASGTQFVDSTADHKVRRRLRKHRVETQRRESGRSSRSPERQEQLTPPRRQRSSRAELQDLPGGTSTPGDVWCLRSTATLGDTRNGATHKERGPDCCGETCARSWRASNDRDGRLAVSHPRAATKWYRRTPAHLAIQGVAAARPSRRTRYRPHHGCPTRRRAVNPRAGIGECLRPHRGARPRSRGGRRGI